MKTVSVSELHDKSNVRFESLSAKIDARGDKPLTKTLETRLNEWGESRIAILRAGSGRLQIQEYGAERFAKNYVRIQDVRVSELLCPKGTTPAKLLETIWRSLPNSPFKRFQELFCEPRNYVVPKFSIAPDGKIDFGSDLMRRTRSVAPCIVAPYLISDALVESLGLATFSEAEQKSPALRFFRKAKIDVRQGIKERWDNARPLSDRDFRIMVLRKPSSNDAADLNAEYPLATPMPRGLHGSILMSRAAIDNSLNRLANGLIQPKNATQRIAAHYSSAFAALRKSDHQRAGYDTESVDLATISAKLRRIGDRIGTEWRRGALDDVKNELLGDLKATAMAALDVVDGAEDPKKIEVGRRISHCQDLRDSLNRLNPKSSESQIFQSLNLLNLRLKEVAHKGGYNETDRALLSAELKKQIVSIKLACDALRELPFATRIGHQERARLQRILAANESDLSLVTLKPLSTFAGIIRLYGRKAAQGLEKGQANRTPTNKIEMVSRLFDAALSIEQMKGIVSTDGAIDFPTLIKHSNTFRTSVPHSALATSNEGRAISEKLGTFYADVRTHLDKFKKIVDSDSQQIVWAERFRELLRNVDIEALTLSLIPKR